MSHYETLGVDKSATPDEIKRAYRKKASEAHPDREGAKGDMVAINRAMDVLGDPGRRAHYDQTGTEQGASPIEDEARNMLLAFFDEAIKVQDEGDWVGVVQNMLAQNLQGASNVIAESGKRIKKLEKARRRVRVRQGENMVQHLIDQQLAKQRAVISNAERSRGVTMHAQRMLENYEMDFSFDAPRTQSAEGWGWGGGSSYHIQP